MNNQFMEDYRRGMETLYLMAPYLYYLTQNLGIPVDSEECDTAMVVFDPAKKDITFHVNGKYVADLDDEQVAFVLAHEAYHVAMKHSYDQMDKQYSDKNVLMVDHECIVNDTIAANVALNAPEGLYHGEAYNADFSLFDTKQGYDYLKSLSGNDDNDESNDDNSADNASNTPSPSTAGGAGGTPSGSNDANAVDTVDMNADNVDKINDSENSDNDENGSSEDADSVDNNAGSGNNADDGNVSTEGKACGGIVGVSVDNEKSFEKAVAAILSDTLKDMENAGETVPDDFQNIIASQVDSNDDNVKSFGISDSKNEVFATSSVEDINLNWKKLLALIDPKVMTVGQKRVKYVWNKPARRMNSLYPKVILPNVKTKGEANKDGDEKATVMLALDFSGSISYNRIKQMTTLADEVPEEFFHAETVTWSNCVVPYDKDVRKVVSQQGTNIDGLYEYTQKFAQKNGGKQPHVVVITDGVCSFNHYYWRKASSHVDANIVKKNWFWVGFNDQDVQTIHIYFKDYLQEDNVFRLDDLLD